MENFNCCKILFLSIVIVVFCSLFYYSDYLLANVSVHLNYVSSENTIVISNSTLLPVYASTQNKLLEAVYQTFSIVPQITLSSKYVMTTNNLMTLTKQTTISSYPGNCIYQLPKDWFKILRRPKELPRKTTSRIPAGYFIYKEDTPFGYTNNSCYLNLDQNFCNFSHLNNFTPNKKILIIAVLSTVVNFNVRQAIRKSYGSIFLHGEMLFKTVFFIGHTTAKHDKNLQKLIDEESKQYKDIVQEDVSDGYLDITFKCMAIFKWFSYFCTSATYLVRVTDDSVVNLFGIEKKLRSASSTDYSGGAVLWNSAVLNNLGTKWDYLVNVPVDIPWTGAYAPYYSGAFSLYSSDLVQDMYMISRKTPVFFPDDAYLGVLMEKLGKGFSSDVISNVNHGAYHHLSSDQNLPNNILKVWMSFS